MGLNYFSFTTALLYMKDIKRYQPLKKCIIKDLLAKLESNKHVLKIDSESILLFLDVLSCPYIDRTSKYKACGIFGITRLANKRGVIASNQYWFTKWKDFDLSAALDRKRSLEVY